MYAEAAALGFDRMIISATTPFGRDDMERLRIDAAAEGIEDVDDLWDDLLTAFDA